MTTHPPSPPPPNPATPPDDDRALAPSQRTFALTCRALLLIGLPLALLSLLDSLQRGRWLTAIALLIIAALAARLTLAARTLVAAHLRTLAVTRAALVERSQALHDRDRLLYDIGEAMPHVLIYQTEMWPGQPPRYTYIGGAGGERWGVTLEQAYADPMSVWARIHPDDRRTFFQAVQEANEHRRVLEHELRIRMPDGSIRWSFCRSMPQFLPDGRVVRSGIEFDITERKAADMALAEQLRYSEALASCSQILLIEGADAPDWQGVVERTLTTLRDAVDCARLGLRIYPSPDDILDRGEVIISAQRAGLPPFQNPPVTYDDIPPALRQAAARGEPVSGRLEDVFPPGGRGHAHFAVNGVRALIIIGAVIGGRWRGHLAVSEQADRAWSKPTVSLLRTGTEMITAFVWRWEMTSALRTREAQLRALGDNLPNGFIYQMRYAAGKRRAFTYLSSGVASILGVTAEEGLRDAATVYARVAPEERARVAEADRISNETMGIFAEVMRHLRPDGEERWLYLCSRPRRVTGGLIIRDGLAIDVTDQQRAAAELAAARDAAEAAARAKSAFLASMSHEIRTPLNAVIGMAALLEDTALSDEQRVFVETIGTGGQALLSVINDILDFSRIESGHVELGHEPFDLPACLHSTVELVAHAARKKGLEITCAFAPAVPRYVAGDKGRLRQVLLNLLGNAVKFTARGAVALRVGLAGPEGDGPAAAPPEPGPRDPFRGGRQRDRHGCRAARAHLRAVCPGRAHDGPALRRHRAGAGDQPAAGGADGRRA